MTSTKNKLDLLTDYFTERQDAILIEWEERMMHTEGKSTELARMSRQEFRNHIPTFLKGFNESLTDRDVTLEETGRKHGADRWEYGMELQEMVKEWNLLHQVLMDELNTAQDKLQLSFDTYKEAQKSLAEHIDEGVLYSIKEFDELRRFETEAQIMDIKEVLKMPDQQKHESPEAPGKLAREESLRGTSHDLKGIMKSLQMGFFLLEDEEMSERSSHLISQMALAADSLDQLLNDLLDLFRLETHKEELHVTNTNIAYEIRELCESLQPMAQSQSLELECSGVDSLLVKTDTKKIQRVVRNLVLNALKYTHQGYVKVHCEAISDKQWLLEISDTGPGLSATHAHTLTTEVEYSDSIDAEEAHSEDSHSTKEVELPPEVKNHGEGIGLLIVRHLCKLLDGLIKVKTSPGRGTTFTLIFPTELSS